MIKERKTFTIDDKVIEIGLKQNQKRFVSYKYVKEGKILRSKYEIYTDKPFEANSYYNKLLNEYTDKIRDLHGL